MFCLTGSAFGLNLGPDDIDVIAAQTTLHPALNVRAIRADTTWTADRNYILTERVFVTDGAVLTIEPGTRIYSTFDDNGTPADKADDHFGALVVTRGARIEAAGTAAEPIVFTTVNELEASRGADVDGDGAVASAPTVSDAGLWGGLVLLGNSEVSFYTSPGVNGGNNEIEGFAPSFAADNDGDGLTDAIEYGHDAAFPLDLADDSGVLRYVSIRHGGYIYDAAAGKEINGLTLGGVGSGTTIDHVEVVANADDGVEFFGGTVSTDHMVMAFNHDDCWDIDEGHSGVHQFWFSIQNPNAADNGGEWDGTGGSKAASNLLSRPVIYNATIIGAGAGAPKGDKAIYIDDYFRGELHNSILDEFNEHLIAGSSTAEAASLESAAFTDNTVGRFGSYAGSNLDVVGPNIADHFYDSLTGDPLNGNSAAGADPLYSKYERDAGFRLKAIDPRPQPGSPALAANGASLAVVPAGLDAAPDYRGAFGADLWIKGWTALDSVFGLIDHGGSSDYATYADATFPGGSGTPNTGEADDFDSDGLSNGYEYAFGLDPTSPSSVSPIRGTLDPTDSMFAYTRRVPSLTGFAYTVEYSTDLANWTPDTTASQTVIGTVDGIQTVHVTLSAGVSNNPRPPPPPPPILDR